MTFLDPPVALNSSLDFYRLGFTVSRHVSAVTGCCCCGAGEHLSWLDELE